jgi:hypothetical protein
MLPFQLRDERPFRFGADMSKLRAFFNTSISIACRPTNRSSSAMRSACGS